MKKIFLSLLILLLSTFSTNAAITVAVGSVETTPGQIVNIPIYISGASGSTAFWSFELKLNYDNTMFGNTKTFQNFTTLISPSGWITNPDYSADTMFCGYEVSSSLVNYSLPDSTLLFEIQMTYTGTVPTNLIWNTENSVFLNVDGEELDCNFLNGTVSPLNNEVPAPILTFPENNAVNIPLNLTFTWEPVTGATNYEIEVSTDSTFSTTLVTTSVTTNQYSITSLSQSTIYYWRVKTEIDANESVWTPAWKFTTMESSALLAPILISPPNNMVGVVLPVVCRWNSAVGSVDYTIQMSTSSIFSSILTSNNIYDTTFSYSALYPSTRYYWRVAANNATGRGPWSEIRSFTTNAYPPTVYTVYASSINENSARFGGNVTLTNGATIIQRGVKYSLSSDMSNPIIVNAPSNGTGLYILDITGLFPGITYYYQAFALNSAGEGLGAVQSFTTLGVSSFTLFGTISYANSVGTPMNDCTVIIKDTNNTEVTRTTTDINGDYAVTGLANGTYNIEVQTTKTPGGINIADLLMIRQYIAGLVDFTPLQLLAANINGSGGVTISDVLPFRQRIAAISPIATWLVGQFVFFPHQVTVDGENRVFDIQSLSGGDVNGSFVPAE